MTFVRNKWYVAGLAALGLLCTWGAVHLLRGENPLMAVLPGIPALAFFAAAAWAARTGSFAPSVAPDRNAQRTPAVVRWLKQRADRAEADAAEKKATSPHGQGPKPRT
jgi:hypothetical protein